MPIVLDGNNLTTYGLLGTLGTQTLSGSSFDLAGIPSTAKRVTILLNSVSLTGTQNLLVQLGSGSVTTTGYLSSWQQVYGGVSSNFLNSTSGLIYGANAAGNFVFATTTLYFISGNTWMASGTQTYDNALMYGAYLTGKVSLIGSLDRIRVTQTGSDTFDSGTVTVYYEG